MAKILIADDSSFMRNMIKDILRKTDHQLLEAEDGEQAITIAQSDKPDLILLDIIMPNMDGIEVLKKLDKTIKIIVVSAIGQEKMLEEAKTFGAFAYIVKPFEEALLLAEVEKALV
jgi:CheY-like chemotaxis protein